MQSTFDTDDFAFVPKSLKSNLPPTMARSVQIVPTYFKVLMTPVFSISELDGASPGRVKRFRDGV